MRVPAGRVNKNKKKIVDAQDTMELVWKSVSIHVSVNDAAGCYCVAVFRSGACTSRIVAVGADHGWTVRPYGTNCRYRPPKSLYLPGTEASDVTPGGCTDVDVVPVPELVVANWSNGAATVSWV